MTKAIKQRYHFENLHVIRGQLHSNSFSANKKNPAISRCKSGQIMEIKKMAVYLILV